MSPSSLWKFLFKISGWQSEITIDYFPKCVICVAPHTSNLDFFIGLMAYRSLGRKANFLMKKFWFFFPLGILLRKLGGIPVDRDRKTSLTSKIISLFKTRSYLNLAVTPEGTRKANENWHTGFLRIAYESHVPVLLAVIDYSQKMVLINKIFYPTGNYSNDMKNVKEFYARFEKSAKYPSKFKL